MIEPPEPRPAGRVPDAPGLADVAHARWLAAHRGELLRFAEAALPDDHGARWLDDVGHPDEHQPIHTWITARMLYVFSLALLAGDRTDSQHAARALAALLGPLHDDEFGGTHPHVTLDGDLVVEVPDEKSCYDHAFVALAASTAVRAGVEGADRLLDLADRVFLERFWDDEVGRCVDTWNRDFTSLGPYRGLNANMHAVEAMLALSAVGRTGWLDRARRICRFTVEQGAAHEWRLPEHYDERWRPDLDASRDDPANPFRPYGATVGHGLEWSRLLVQLARASPDEAPWMLDAASRLFARATADGWSADGRPGFVYTTDWNGQPVVVERMHWVAAEAIAAAATMHQQTGDPEYARRYGEWWRFVDDHHLDHDAGSWHHELDALNRPSSTVWAGKPDVYHAYQAALIPIAPEVVAPPPAPSAATTST